MSQTVHHGKQATFQVIPLTQLHESPENPRRHFDAGKLQELTDSVKLSGILTPLLVRPNAKGFEIAAGHRRYRAAQSAELTEVPCVVREMTDQQFMEILTIENLQREDVHALDEAKGYDVLMKAPYRMPVEKIAERVGRSVTYIYDSVKLLELNKEAQQLFWAGKIEKGHAVLLARLSPADQKRCIESDDALFRGEQTLYHDGEKPDPKDKYAGEVACSVAELRDWIKRHVRYDFKKPDAFLFPETAAAVTAATEANLKIVEITDERLAHDDVRNADRSKRVFGEQAWKRADGKAGSKSCEYAVLGVFASGQHRGETFDVCTRKDKCAVHWGKEIRARDKGRKAAGSVASSTEKREVSKWEKEQAERKVKELAWEKALPSILEQAAEVVRTMPIKANGELGTYLCKAIEWNGGDKEAIATIKRGTTAEDLIRHLAFIALYDDAKEYGAYDQFPKTAKWLGIDFAAIVKAANPAEEKKPAPAKKKKGKAA